MKLRAYIYPRTNRSKTGSYNPYINNLIVSTNPYIDFLNKDSPSSIGLLNLINYVGKIDVLFLNWIEDLPDKKFGYFQSIIFLCVLRLKKIFGIKVVWTLHNKISHSPRNFYFKKRIFLSLLKRTDLFITHAEEGIEYAESLYPGVSSKIFYRPHPITSFPTPEIDVEKNYDILIWGRLSPYKGIDSFLEFLQEKGLLEKYKILITGKAGSTEFLNKLERLQNKKIKIVDQYISHDDLAVLIRKSEVILFTYSGNSVLSSGALIDSISHKGLIIGPNIGAFRELARMGLIITYDNFDELPEIIDRIKTNNNGVDNQKILDFIESNSWEKFGKELQMRLQL